MVIHERAREQSVDPPGAVLRSLEVGLGCFVICKNLPNWDRFVVAGKLRNPWQAVKIQEPSRHEPGTFHDVYKFDEDGYQVGNWDYAEGVTDFWFGEDSVTIAVASAADAARVMAETSDLLEDAYARRRESLEKLGIPTDPDARVSFLMGKVGGSGDNNDPEAIARVIRERRWVENGIHPLLSSYENWPTEFLPRQTAEKARHFQSRRTGFSKLIRNILGLSERDPLSASERRRLEDNWREREKKRRAAMADQIVV